MVLGGYSELVNGFRTQQTKQGGFTLYGGAEAWPALAKGLPRVTKGLNPPKIKHAPEPAGI